MRSPKLILLTALAVLLFTPGCALVNLLVQMPTPTPVAQRALRPTFTPTPNQPTPAPVEEQPPAVAEQPATPVPPESGIQPLQAVAEQPPDTVAPPAVTPTEPPTATPEPPTPTPTATATPTPYIVVDGGLVRARTGPGTSYDQVGEFPQGTQLALVAKNADGTWWQVCCLNEQPVWVTAELVTVQGPAEAVAVAANIPPSPTPTATPEPKPYAIVRNPSVNLRTGPGLTFEVLGQARQGARLEIVGRNDASDWWQVCCVNGQQGWISGELVRLEGPVAAVALSPDLPTPTPAASPTAVAIAPTLTAPPEDAAGLLFELTDTEQFPFGGNDYFRVAAKVRDAEDNPLGGAYLRIRSESTGQEWLSRQSGDYAWEYSAPSADFGDFRQINIQFDTNGQAALLGNNYAVWLVNGSGQRVSPVVRFEPGDDEPQWLYVVFTRE